MRKNRVIFLTVFVLLFIFLNQSGFGIVVDKVLVIVNDEIITQGDLERILFPVYQRYRMQYTDEELAGVMEETRRSVLMRLIQDKLLLSEARRKKIEVTEEEVQKKTAEMRKRFRTEEEFEIALAQEDLILSELEKKHRERIMIDKLIDSEIRGGISVSPSEIMAFYEKNKDLLKEPRQVKIRSILIRVNDARSEEEARKLAEELLGRLAEGGDFALLAKTYSEGPYADSGGDMGWVKEGELMARINDLVFELDENEISGILKTDLGFHIFMAEEKKISKPRSFSEARERIEQILYNQKVQEKLNNWMEELKQNAYIAFR